MKGDDIVVVAIAALASILGALASRWYFAPAPVEAQGPRHAWIEWSDTVGIQQKVFKVRAEGRCFIVIQTNWNAVSMNSHEVPCS